MIKCVGYGLKETIKTQGMFSMLAKHESHWPCGLGSSKLYTRDGMIILDKMNIFKVDWMQCSHGLSGPLG